MSHYYEDFAAGSVFESRGRTVTEADIVNFAGLSGDFVELHTNEEYARQSPFGRRIAHGALIFSISTGLMTQMNLINETVLAFYGMDKLRFTAPVFIGDTVRVVKSVVEMREKDAERGVVTFETQVLNQKNEAVIVYTDKLLLKRRP
ncbi:MAG: MaoC/PaaZ C-terminal domain-containing protein [Bryobacteraceae bacterium]